MTNKLRGEVALSVGSGDTAKTYILRFSANALCDLEEITGKSIMNIMADVKDPEKMSMTTVRAMIYAGLKEHHPKITLQDAGNIVQDLTMLGAYLKVAEAAKAAFPDVEEDPPQPVGPLKEPPPAGTGLDSTKAGLN